MPYRRLQTGARRGCHAAVTVRDEFVIFLIVITDVVLAAFVVTDEKQQVLTARLTAIATSWQG